jgi:hypothetical protein
MQKPPKNWLKHFALLCLFAVFLTVIVYYVYALSPPTLTSVTIKNTAGSASYTKTTSVKIWLNGVGSDPDEIKIGNASDGGSFSSYTGTGPYNWSLTNSDGTKTVWVTLKNASGNVQVFDTILLDTAAPTGLTFSPGITAGAWHNVDSFVVNWANASDSGSGVAGYSCAWDSTPPNTVGTTATILTKTGIPNDAVNTYTLKVKVIDNAGNASSDFSSGPFKIDRQNPGAPGALTSSTVPENSTTWHNNTLQATWTAASDGSGSGVAGYTYVWSQTKDQNPGQGTTQTSCQTSEYTPAINGQWWLMVRVKDNVDLWSTSTKTYGPFQIDKQNPGNVSDLAITSAHYNGNWHSEDTVSFSGSATDAVSSIVGYYTTWTNSSADPSATPSKIHTGSSLSSSKDLSDGTWYLHAKAVDAAGNWSSGWVHSAAVKVDTTPPNAVPTHKTSSISEGDTWHDVNSVTVEWNAASDATSPIAGYNVFWDNAASTLRGTRTSFQTATAISSTKSSITDGTWYVHVTAKDSAGNWGTTVHFGPYRVDHTNPPKPQFSSSDPEQDTFSPKNTISVTWTQPADGSGGGVEGQSYACKFTQNSNKSDTNNNPGTNPGVSGGAFDGDRKVISDVLGSDGAWYLYVRAIDKAGNVTDFSDVAQFGPFKIDFTPPSDVVAATSVSPPTDTWTNDNTISITLTKPNPEDNYSNIEGYRFLWDHSSSSPVSNGPYTQTGLVIEQTLTQADDHYLHVKAVDAAGNLSNTTYHLGPFKVDVTPPPVPPAPVVSNVFDNNSATVECTWVNTDNISITWPAIMDEVDGSGLDYYSYAFNTTAKDTTIFANRNNAGNTSFSKTGLTNGMHYLHIRTYDVAGNDSTMVAHYGPFCIDQSPPVQPDEALDSSTPAINDNTYSGNSIEACWPEVLETPGQGEIEGYSYVWSTASDTSPDNIIDVYGNNAFDRTVSTGNLTEPSIICTCER